ncbi:hypothetical protein [Pseudomonas sichuanensis]|uniref:hypothetical protein n=1 Tax=Pseudomonas sichuanensis TaxID=2213015 RepID=UPI00215FB753|nr:hypothetical protein [Pseudomonas sichuanensis]UVL91833.1 hypothetical protein LOY51_13460 [Pseudomonas sichuanensis]
MKLLLTLWLLYLPALAADPEVRVAQRLVPEGAIMVGGTVSLEIDLLVDTWFTDAPVLPALDLPGAVVSPPTGEAQHLNQDIDGKRFFGLRYSYRITPQAARHFDIPALAFQVQPGPASGPLTVSSQPLAFEAKGGSGNPDSAQPVAAQLTFTQQVERSHTPLRAGDTVTRRLRIVAPGAQAMLLHAPELAEVAGLKRYVQTPGVKPLSDGRGGTLGGEREDTVTYVIGAAGRYQLPEITYQWRDATSGEVHQTQVPAVALEAIAGAYQAPFSINDDLRAMGHQARLRFGGHWLLLVAAVLGAGALAWGLRARWQALWQRLRRWQARRQQAWLDSPGYAWRQARAQCAAQPPKLDALYLWVRRSSGQPGLLCGRAQIPDAIKNRLLASFRSRFGVSAAPEQAPIALPRTPPAQHPSEPQRSGLKPLNR